MKYPLGTYKAPQFQRCHREWSLGNQGHTVLVCPIIETKYLQSARNLARMPSQDARILARMPKSALWWGTKLTDGDNPQICIGIRFWFAL